jgi:hypothetical protein
LVVGGEADSALVGSASSLEDDSYCSHSSSTSLRDRGLRFSRLPDRHSKQYAQWAGVAIVDVALFVVPGKTTEISQEERVPVSRKMWGYLGQGAQDRDTRQACLGVTRANGAGRFRVGSAVVP